MWFDSKYGVKYRLSGVRSSSQRKIKIRKVHSIDMKDKLILRFPQLRKYG